MVAFIPAFFGRIWGYVKIYIKATWQQFFSFFDHFLGRILGYILLVTSCVEFESLIVFAIIESLVSEALDVIKKLF